MVVKRIIKYAVFWGMAIIAKDSYTQDLSSFAEGLKSNTVKLTVVFPESQAQETGFGIITGERGEYVYIITPQHVAVKLDENDVNIIKSEIKVEFSGFPDVTYPGRLLKYSTKYDIALIEVSKPPLFRWEKKCIAPSFRKDERVTFIGRNGDWYIPAKQAEGSINTFRNDRIIVDIASVRPGTSGAPLITNQGIIGMISTDDDVNQAEALWMDFIKDFVTDFDDRPYAFSLEDILHEGPPLWLGLGTAVAGASVLAFGINDEIVARSNHEIYKNNRIESAPIYNPNTTEYVGHNREDLYTEANKQHKRGIVMITAGSIVLAVGGTLIMRKINVDKKNNQSGFIPRKRIVSREGTSIHPYITVLDFSSGNLGIGLAVKF